MTVKLKVNGPIVSNDEKWIYEWLDYEATCPNDITNLLPTNGEDVELTINSYGGLVDSGNEIYTALRSYTGKVIANVVMAGSAASLIAMGADTVRMSPVGQIMIHNITMTAGGDYHDMDKASEILQKSNESLAAAYEIKTGKTQEELLALMDEETWMTAKEAMEHGFADEIMDGNQEKPLLVADGGSGMIDPKIINKLKAQREASPTMTIDTTGIAEMIDEKLNSFKKDIEDQLDPKEQPKNEENESGFSRFIF